MKTSTRPPSGVNLIAFASRFQITCCSRPASPLTGSIAGRSRENASCTFLAAANGRTASSAACATATRSTGCGAR